MNVVTMCTFGVSVPWKFAKTVKNHLDAGNTLRKDLQPLKTEDRLRVVFPLRIDDEDDDDDDDDDDDGDERDEGLSNDALARRLKEELAIPCGDVIFDRFPFAGSKRGRRGVDDGGDNGSGGIQKRIVDTLEIIAKKIEEESASVEDLDPVVAGDWRNKTPKFSWERHGDLVLLPHNPCFKVNLYLLDLRLANVLS